PIRGLVAMVALIVTPLVRAKIRVRSALVVCFETSALPLASFAKLQAAIEPGPTITVGLLGAPGVPGRQALASSTKSALAASLTVYVPAGTRLKVAVPIPELVAMVALMVTPLDRKSVV